MQKLLSSPTADQNASGEATPTLQERKQQLVRDAIWQAATDLFSEKGYDETTVEDIAEKAGVSRRSFFRYFSSKSDLLAHGTVHYGLAISSMVRSFPPGYPLPAVFGETVIRIAEQSTTDPRMRRLMEIAARHSDARAAQIMKMIEVHDRVAEAYADRPPKRSEKHLIPSILAGLTVSVLGVIFRVWFEQGRKDISAIANQVLQSMERLVCSNRDVG